MTKTAKNEMLQVRAHVATETTQVIRCAYCSAQAAAKSESRTEFAVACHRKGWRYSGDLDGAACPDCMAELAAARATEHDGTYYVVMRDCCRGPMCDNAQHQATRQKQRVAQAGYPNCGWAERVAQNWSAYNAVVVADQGKI